MEVTSATARATALQSTVWREHLAVLRSPSLFEPQPAQGREVLPWRSQRTAGLLCIGDPQSAQGQGLVARASNGLLAGLSGNWVGECVERICGGPIPGDWEGIPLDDDAPGDDPASVPFAAVGDDSATGVVRCSERLVQSGGISGIGSTECGVSVHRDARLRRGPDFRHHHIIESRRASPRARLCNALPIIAPNSLGVGGIRCGVGISPVFLLTSNMGLSRRVLPL
jgi:hypothetical protein